MRKRIAVAVVLAVLLAASACAQTADFFTLVGSGTPQDVQAAISKGADVSARNKVGQTPLIVAADINRNPEVITTLLKAGADIEARDTVHGGTALLWAASFNQNPDVITALLKAGADISARGIGERTALIMAALNNANPEVIMVLLKAGADAKVQDFAEMTAFDYAQGNEKLNGTDALKQLEEASK